MNQAKIGMFIAKRRKEKGLTQSTLAEKLGITDRAVSKWERGKALPDASIMLTLCDILEITVNDLLSGEVVLVENYNKELENKLLEMVKEKEKADKRLLTMETIIGVMCVVVFFVLTIVAAYIDVKEWIRVMLIFIGLIPLLVAVPVLLKIEQVAGYYECKNCGHKYIPTYKAVNMAPHMGRTRYMKCPKCGEKTWQRKVINKD